MPLGGGVVVVAISKRRDPLTAPTRALPSPVNDWMMTTLAVVPSTTGPLRVVVAPMPTASLQLARDRGPMATALAFCRRPWSRRRVLWCPCRWPACVAIGRCSQPHIRKVVPVRGSVASETGGVARTATAKSVIRW